MKSISIEIKWSLLFSILTLVWMILEKSIGLHDQYINKHPIYTNLYMIVAIGAYYLALKEKKKYSYQGNMTWKQGFIAGVIISIFVSLLSPIVQYITFKYITPDFFENMIAYAVSHKIQTQTQAEAYFNIPNYIIQGVFGGLSMGVITAAIVALIVKNKNIKNEN